MNDEPTKASPSTPVAEPSWAKPLAGSVEELLNLVSITRLAPWQIADIKKHFEVNFTSLSFLFVLFAIARFFTEVGSWPNLVLSGGLYLGALLILFCIGILVRLFETDATKSVKLTNRWSTFLIVSFVYCLGLFILSLLALWVVLRLGGSNFYTDFTDRFDAEWEGLLVISLVVATVATLLLWWRTHRTFPDFHKWRGWRLAGVLALTILSVGTTFFLVTFTL